MPATHRPGYPRQDSIDAGIELNAVPTVGDVQTPGAASDKNSFIEDPPHAHFSELDGVKFSGVTATKEGSILIEDDGEIEHLAAHNVLANGKERPIETADDIATRCMSLEDDPTLPIHTFRMYFLGLGLTCFAAVLGQIFYFRPQTVYVSQLFIQVIAFILGKAWYLILPKASRGKLWAFLNPGDFNIKEHVAIVIMSSTATHSALAISVFASDELFYNITPNYGVSIFALVGSQMFGYGIAGLMRAFVVYPTYIVFPNLVPTVNLFDALHRDQNTLGQKKRLRFFWIVFVVIFVWEWIPEFVAPLLTGISVFCLARKNSYWVTRIFGGANGNEGLGMFSLCLDWNYVGSGGGSLGALFTPFSTQLSQYFGIGLCCLAFCVAYYNDTWHAQNFPFLSQQLFYENGTIYDQTLILNADYSLNQTALAQQGTPWYATSNAIYSIGATITHVLIWYLPQIRNAIKEYRSGTQPDPHYQKMLVYKEVPMWWYWLCVAISFACAMATCYTGHSQLPWWALIVALGVTTLIFPFVVIVYAVTGFVTDTQLLAQMLGSALVPGNSQANMYFTLYGANTITQARGLARDLKLGQYSKLPPRATFITQTIGTLVGAILQLVIMKTIISSQREILLDIQGSNIWSGQAVQSFNSQAVTWGALAKSMYGPGSPYFLIPMGILIGLAIPLPFWVAHQFWPRLKADHVVTPILCWCLGNLSVGINSSIFTTVLLAIFSQYYLRRYRATWFRKYNYLLSAGLDAGTQVMSFIATFALFGASGTPVTMPTWALNPDSATHNLDYCIRIPNGQS